MVQMSEEKYFKTFKNASLACLVIYAILLLQLFGFLPDSFETISILSLLLSYVSPFVCLTFIVASLVNLYFMKSIIARILSALTLIPLGYGAYLTFFLIITREEHHIFGPIITAITLVTSLFLNLIISFVNGRHLSRLA